MPDVDRLLNAIDAEEESAYGSDENGDLAEERSRNIDRYTGRNTIPAPEGRSNVQDSSVYDTIQWMKPSLARIFASGDDLVRLPPVGPEDEEGSKQESEYLNFQILQKNDWFGIFDTAQTDALTVKAAYLHPYAEKIRQVERETYLKQTPESLALLMQDQPEVADLKEYPDPDYVAPPPQVAVDPMTGQQVMVPSPPPPMLYDITIRRTKVETRYCIDVLPPERCKISQSCKKVQVSTGCPYFEYWDYLTLSELRAENYGVDIPDDIADNEEENYTAEDTARDRYSEFERRDQARLDPSMRRVKVRYCWIRHDYDEDGIAELQFVVRVGKTMLYREERNRIEVAVLCPDPSPHRHIGSCPADRAAEIQDINTVLLRQGIDNAQLSNNPIKFGDPSKVNMEDAKVSRPGGFIRTRNGAIFGQDFGVLQIPDVLPQVIGALQYTDNLRQRRTGVGMSFQGLDPNQLSQLQPGTVNQVSSMEAQRVEYVARHFANGIVEMCSILHEIILKSGHKKDVVQLRGKWVEVDPSTWRSRKDFRIAVGYSAGNKDSQMARINMLAAMQKEALVGGLRICTEENAYNTAIELTKAADFPNPDRFWTDPKSLPPPPPPQPDPTVVAMEQIKAQSADGIKRMDVAQKERDSIRDAEIKKYQTDVDAQVKLQLANVQGQNAIAVKQFENDAAVSTEHRKAIAKNQPALDVADQVQALASQLSEGIESLKGALQIVLTAKRQVRKGKNGRAEGVDTVAHDGTVIASHRVVRDETGGLLGTEPT